MWPGAVDLSCVHGAQSDWANSTVVVPAVYREWHGHGPPEWLQAQYPVYLYQRANASARCFCANRGFESGVYFTFIARHYAHLPAFVAFVQGDWIFKTKTSAGGAFRFWQPQCAGAASSGRPWSEYMPLGGRRTAWPPRCVIRQTSWYGRFVGKRNGAIVEACARELLHEVGWSGAVRPYDKSRPLNITFYTNMNFLASRARLRRYTHRAYRRLAQRFVEDGLCVPRGGREDGGGREGGGGGREGGGGGHSGAEHNEVLRAYNGSLVDDAAYGKWTLGMATELLQQSLFGDGPLEDGPPPEVPLDAEHCTSRATTSCQLSS